MLSPLSSIACIVYYSCVLVTMASQEHTSSPWPIAVSIMTFGIHTPAGKVVMNHIKANPEKFHPAIDIRRVLKADPAKRKIYKISHWENADHLTTQLNLFHDGQFYHAVRTLVDHIEAKNDEATSIGAPKVFPVYCTAGVHRCDGAAKCTAYRVLNKVSVGGEKRLYSAKVFSCSNIDPNNLADTVFKEAFKWTHKPWTVARGEDWASAASDANSRAHKQLEWIDDLARLLSGVDAPSLDAFTKKPLVDDLSASSGEEDVTFVADDEPGSSSQNDTYAAPKNRPRVPHPPRDPPPIAKRQRSPSYYRDDDSDRSAGEHQGFAQHSHGQASRDDHNDRRESDGHWETCPCCAGKGWVDNRYKLGDDAATWTRILTARGCDTSALHDWLALHSSHQGHDAALKLVHKVMKKDSGGYDHEIVNVSAFLCRAVRNAWHDVQDQRVAYT